MRRPPAEQRRIGSFAREAPHQPAEAMTSATLPLTTALVVAKTPFFVSFSRPVEVLSELRQRDLMQKNIFFLLAWRSSLSQMSGTKTDEKTNKTTQTKRNTRTRKAKRQNKTETRNNRRIEELRANARDSQDSELPSAVRRR